MKTFGWFSLFAAMVAIFVWLWAERDEESGGSLLREAGTLTGSTRTSLPQREEDRTFDYDSLVPDEALNCAQAGMPATMGWVISELDRAAIELAGQDSAESFVAAAMLNERDKVAAFELLRLATEKEPSNRLAWWQLLHLCDSSDKIECDIEQTTQSALAADGGNAAVWLALMGTRLEAGDHAGALAAARQAVAAPDLETFLSQQVLLVDRSLSATTTLSLRERVILGTDGIATSIPADLQTMRHCGETSSPEWQDLCAQIGERLASQSGDLNLRRTGLRMQRYFAEQTGDTSVLRDIDAQLAAIQEIDDFETADGMKGLNLMLNDDAVLMAFIQNLHSSGELEAFSSLRSDVARLEQTPGYDACNFQVNPFFQF